MRVRGLLLSSTVFIAILMGLAAPGVAQASSSTVIATYVVHGKGGNGGLGTVGSVEGTLLADGTATGSGQVTTTTPGGPFTFQVQAVGWVAVSPTTYGILTVASVGGSDCVLLPVGVAKPAPAHHTLTGNCSDPAVFVGTYGKVTPTS
jgi:hypothetical protein